MTTPMTLWFMAVFAAPIAWQRTKRFIWPGTFLKLNPLRRYLRIDLHHGHIGLFAALAIAYAVIFFPGTRSVWMGLGFVYSLGLLVDELVAYFASTKGVTRQTELDVYDNSFGSTIRLAIYMEIGIALTCSYAHF